MSQFCEKPLPEYINKREEKESLRWVGSDSSLDIFPHLNLDWKQIEKIIKKSQKPIGEFGSSFSPIPVEGELRGIDILSVDLMHEYNKDRYEFHLGNIFRRGYEKELYISQPTFSVPKTMEPNERIERDHYEERVEEAIKKVMKERLIVADIAHLPLEDRSLSIVMLHDTLPKHSPNLQTFLEKQLPEILRVTDQTVYIYPMSIYKTELWKSWKQSEDIETNYEDIWVKASEMTPEDKAEEKLAWQMSTYDLTGKDWDDDRPQKNQTIEEAQPLYKEAESIKQISETAKKLGFEFKLEKSSDIRDKRGKQEDDAKLGVFSRIPNKK